MSEAVATAPDSAPLSVEAAIQSLMPQPEAAPAEAPQDLTEDQPESEAEPTAEDADGAQEAPAEGEEDAEQPEPETPAVEAPHFWDAAAKTRFAQLPPDLQAVVLEQERGREAIKSKAVEEAAKARKEAEGRASQLTQLSDELSAVRDRALATFKDRWADVNWVELASQVSAEQYNALKAQHEAEQQQAVQTAQAAQKADEAAMVEYLKAESARLPELVPDLVDPKDGQARYQRIAQHAVERGIAPEQFRRASAVELSILYDAMRYREAEAKAKDALANPRAPRPASAPARPPVRPTAAPRQTSQAQQIASLQGRFHQNPSKENAVALLLAKKA